MAKDKRLDPDAIAGNVNKKFGGNTLVLASKAIGLVKPRFSTGSFALDLLTGGGAPEGAIELITGDPQGGKSLGLLQRMASFLNKHPDGTCVLINAEKTNDADFLRLNGVDTSRTFIAEPDSGEQAWDIIHDVAASAKKVYIAIDSLDAMVPLAELESDMDGHHYAPAAKMNNKGFRKLINLMKSDITTTEHRVTIGVIAQLRESIGVYGDNKRTVGGGGKIYAAMSIIRCRKVKDLRTEGKTLMDKKCYGTILEVKIEKSKGRGQGEVLQYNYYKENFGGFTKGSIDNVSEVIPFALKMGLINQAGAWFDYKDSSGKEQKLQGASKLSKALASDKATLDMFMAKIIEEEEKRHAPE